MALVRDKSGIH